MTHVSGLSLVRTLTAGLMALSVMAMPGAALAAGGKTKELKHNHWSFDGVFGKYDKEAVQRGWQVYSEVCSNCHSIEQLSFRNLGQKGGPFYMAQCPAGAPESLDCSNPNDNPVVQKIAEDYKFQVTDGPDEYGDMFERAPGSSDKIPGPYPNKQLARVSNNGALPPDMSLLAKARHHGPDYIYSLLQGYKEVPDTVEVAPGQYYNEYYPGDMSLLVKEEYRDAEGHILKDVKVPYGGVFAMAQPIYDEQVDYADESIPETIDQYASDVSEFLMWAAEPKLEARKQLGMMSVIYLLILTGLLYWSYREIWSKDH
ncbi:MAG: cytochrome c1 [Pseudomonadota bacterium]